MEAPECKTCGTKHWSREPCPTSVQTKPVPTPKKRVLNLDDLGPPPPGTEARLEKAIEGFARLTQRERNIVRDVIFKMGGDGGPQGEPYLMAAIDALDAASERANPKFDRVAYQREYMREWRKRRKEQG